MGLLNYKKRSKLNYKSWKQISACDLSFQNAENCPRYIDKISENGHEIE